MHNQEVIFNENDRSIESQCCIFNGKKWRSAYLLCSQPNDVCTAVLTIFKNRKNRLKKKAFITRILDTFVGFETSFELQKQRNTMCIISSKELPIISFSSMENLILWESWIDQTCCRGSLFYLQLLAAPEKSRANLSLYREVRLHMHDGRFALVEGRPQRIIGFWRIKDVIRISFISNVLHFFAHDPSGVDDGMYSLACGKIEEIEKHFSMCKKAGVLLSYLRHKSGNDCWLHAYAESVSPVSNRSYTFHYPVLQFNDGFPEAVPPSQKRKESVARSCDAIPRAGYLCVSETKVKNNLECVPDDPLVESLTPFVASKPIHTIDSNHSLYENLHLYENLMNGTLPKRSKIFEKSHYLSVPILNRNQPKYINIVNNSELFFHQNGKEANETVYDTSHQFLSSNREYSNLTSPKQIHSVNNRNSKVLRSDSWPKNSENRNSAASDTKVFGQVSQRLEPEYKNKYTKQEQRKSRSKAFGGSGFKNKLNSGLSHRSKSVGLESGIKRSTSSRQENWDRAKRIIGGSRRSFNDLKTENSKLTMSLDRIAMAASGSPRFKSSHGSLFVGDGGMSTFEKMSRMDLVLNIDSSHQEIQPSTSMNSLSPMPGLVKIPPKKFGFNRTKQLLAQNLQKSITGSYSKYDGERATHHYNPEDPMNMPAMVDCLESAVKKGRERLLEADRRNSDFVEELSFRGHSNRYPKRNLNSFPSGCSKSMGVTHNLASQVIHERTGSREETDVLNQDSSTSSSTDITESKMKKKLVVNSDLPKTQSTEPSLATSAPPIPPKTYLLKKTAPSDQLSIQVNNTTDRSHASSSVSKTQITPSSSPTKKNQNHNNLPELSKLTGNYCDLIQSIDSTCVSRKPSETNRTLYVSIDSVATVAASKAQATMMEVRERQYQVNGLQTNGKYYSELSLNGRKKTRRSLDQPRQKDSFVRRFWRRPTFSLSYTDLRF